VKGSILKPLNLPVTGNIFTGNGKEKIRKFTGNYRGLIFILSKYSPRFQLEVLVLFFNMRQS
jgi:hypothetical protein